ncbi:MAG: hypothetical protein C4584_02720 [Armatimonadetes bacterium]|nr:MAG: hypothetical protein C4584_02720 [Armatimonadota bacterium]
MKNILTNLGLTLVFLFLLSLIGLGNGSYQDFQERQKMTLHTWTGTYVTTVPYVVYDEQGKRAYKESKDYITWTVQSLDETRKCPESVPYSLIWRAELVPNSCIEVE